MNEKINKNYFETIQFDSGGYIMNRKYTGAWAVFDEDYSEGLDSAFARYREAGIKHIMYAGIAHTFEVHDKYYSETCINPMMQIEYEEKKGDIFGTKYFLINTVYDEISALAKKYDLDIGLNITPGVSDPIVEKYPLTAVVDIEGRRSRHWMCPSNPDVRKYFYGRIEDILTHNISSFSIDVGVLRRHRDGGRAAAPGAHRQRGVVGGHGCGGDGVVG